MKTRLLLITVFVSGLTIGWLGNAWIQPDFTTTVSSISVDFDDATVQAQVPTSEKPEQSAQIAFDASGTDDTQANRLQLDAAQSNSSDFSDTSAKSALSTFDNHLSDGRYRDAISLYQELDAQNSPVIVQMKASLLSHLELLTKAKRYDDFSALIDQYLSAYYDDVEVLLLLADFNHANGSYLEVVDVYLLAKTYAYNDIDHQKVVNRFNVFVEEIDRWYTNQRNWLSLISFYSHINTAGLMSSTHQYRQALAYLRSGDRVLAIAQFNLLLGDNVAGDLAAQALDNLTGVATAPVIDNTSSPEYSQSIALQRIGNQYAIALSNNRQDKINLLIDTGASMTAMSSASFHSLGISADAEERDRRVFRTAGGVVMGTVYRVPELTMGPYVLKNTDVAVIDFPTHREIDGLLGMNILGQFRFQIDQENARLRLSEK